MLKKLSVGGYFNIVAAILGLVGVVLTVVSGVISPDNPLPGMPMIAAAGAVGVVLCLVSVWSATRFGNFDIVGSVCILGAIALYCYAFGSAVGKQVMMIAGLFSFNAGNTAGWSVFYVSVGAWACLLVGCLVLIISGFLRTAKQEG